MKKIMMRDGRDDFEAFLIAQAMQGAGADVFSVTYNGNRYIVFSKVRDEDHINKIDKAIIEALDKL